MKVYSDKLVAADLHQAANRPRYWVEELEEIERPRVRSRGWTVRLTGSSNRARNGGTYGANWSSPPATWDEHGDWMAQLFKLDPNARIAHYDGVEDFHAQTERKYA